MSEPKKGVAISKIVIKIKDRELSLTPEEAKDLRDVLTSTLGLKEPQVTTIKEYVYPWYPKPIYYGNWGVNTVPAVQYDGTITSDTTVTVYCNLVKEEET